MNELETFRRTRRLLSGEDLQAWLAAAGLREEDWVRRVREGETAGFPGPLPQWAAPRATAIAPRPAVDEQVQHEWVDAPRACGDAALRLVCRMLGVPVARRLGENASLAELVEAGRAVGLPATALKVSRARMDELAAPWIAHVDGGHWVVVHRTAADEVLVSDPARGAGTLPRGVFAARWSGWCAVFAPVVQSH